MAEKPSWAPPILFAFLVLLYSATLASSRAIDPQELAMVQMHEEWMAKHNRVYNSLEEKEYRFKIFKDNVEHLNAHNQVQGRKYDLGLTKFSDMTFEEVRTKYTTGLHARDDPRKSLNNLKSTTASKDDVPPASVDWRKEGAVTGVKEQRCNGASWAYAVVGAVEGIHKIKTGDLVSLSEQELIDCNTYNINGCDGGWLDSGYQWIVDNKGLNSEEAYPIRSWQGECNKTASSHAVATISGYKSIPKYDEKALQQIVAQQPVSASISISKDMFLYVGGVFDGECSSHYENTIHSVTIVGYDTLEDGANYWIMKNSWGVGWGEEGYMRMAKDVGVVGGMCGLTLDAWYPIA